MPSLRELRRLGIVHLAGLGAETAEVEQELAVEVEHVDPVVAGFRHVELAVADIHELGLDVLALLRAVLAERQQPLVRLVVLLDEAGIVVGDEDVAVRIDRDALGLVEVLVVVALAAEAGEELAGGLVEHLHPGMRRIGDEQMAVLAEGEVLDVLELAFAGAFRADVHHVLEFDLGRRLGHPAERKGQRGARDRTP